MAMLRRRKAGKSGRKKWWVLAGVLAALILVFWLVNHTVNPIILSMSEASVRKDALNAVYESVQEVMFTRPTDEELVSIVRDETGKITMLKANTPLMNDLLSQLCLATEKNLAESATEGVDVPLGSITGSDLLAGQGPKIPVKLIPIGSVQGKFLTEFEDAGINQTRHKVYLEVHATVRVVAPTGSRTVETDSQVLISESIIVGDVPQNYVNVPNTSDMLNMIPDGD